ncbi:sulfatase-like hydrolase/transferase [Falsirhodobacter algicola]|uniref:Sulfatase-like hydrolase/transferase n=1 Tax=Falsirhodobacter algicola TaxID=2692330 RepID=A0A8J8MTQ1_9RHOB|nr:sulfatase-like hydrolase/transferase [Falsirhodobacter algicola]QUS36294.1 sulfatase-like hydrolase/transferase [Falsirhodobacter algicola]
MKLRLTTSLAGLVLAPCAAFAEPNILLIIADDMGIDASFCYDLGDQQAPMPNVEAMCETGLVFDNAYAAPTCSPSRATIMSGLYGFRTGVGAPVDPSGSDQLSPDTPTLFDAMALAGYASNVIGKWHISGRQLGYDMPSQMGVSDYFGLYSGGVQDYFNWTSIEDGKEIQIEGYSTTVLTDRAIDWIAGQDDPWFLWLAYNAPHSPFHLPPDDLHSFDDLPGDDASMDENPLPYYQAMLEALDTEIGRLLASIPEDEGDNTVVVFLGDNGSPDQVTRELFADHGAKATIYDSGTRVPLIVSGPGVKPGRAGDFVNTTDLHATIAALAGAEVSTPDSIDFSPVLTGGKGARDYIHVEHFTDRQTRGGGIYGWAVREGDFKLVAPIGEPQELYNVVEDPFELTNLLQGADAEAFMSVAANLKARREALLEASR